MDTTLTLLLNGSDNVYLNGIAMLATKAWLWIPLYAAIFYTLVREHSYRQFLIIVGGLLIAILLADQISSSIVKPLVARLRPSHDPSIMHLVDVVEGYRGGRYGFFSSHAANTSAITLYLALIFRNRRITVTLVAWTLLNCWTRLYLGVHFAGDIITGLVFGSTIGTVLYYAASRMVDSKNMHRTYSATRLSVITSTFLLTLVVISIPWKLMF